MFFRSWRANIQRCQFIKLPFLSWLLCDIFWQNFYYVQQTLLSINFKVQLTRAKFSLEKQREVRFDSALPHATRTHNRIGKEPKMADVDLDLYADDLGDDFHGVSV